MVESDIWEVDQLNYWILIKIATWDQLNYWILIKIATWDQLNYWILIKIATWDRPKPTVGPVVGGREAGWAEARPTPALLITYKEEHICKKNFSGKISFANPLTKRLSTSVKALTKKDWLV